jgi:hypothetical protein
MTTLTSSRMAYTKTTTKYTSSVEQPARRGERLSHAMQRFTAKFKESKELVPVTFHGRPISRPVSHEIELFGSLSNESNHLNKVIPPLDNPVATFEHMDIGNIRSNLKMHEYCNLKASTACDVPWGTLHSNPFPSKVVWKQSHLVHSRAGHVSQSMTGNRNAANPVPKPKRQLISHGEKPLVYQRRVPRQCLYTPGRTTASNEQGSDVHFLCRRVRRSLNG